MRKKSNLIVGLSLLTVFLVISVGVMLRPDLALRVCYHPLKLVGMDSAADILIERASIVEAEMEIERIFDCGAVWMAIPDPEWWNLQKVAKTRLLELMPKGGTVTFKKHKPGYKAICVPSKHAKLFLCDELWKYSYKLDLRRP